MLKTLKKALRNTGIYLLLKGKTFLPTPLICKAFLKITGINLECEIDEVESSSTNVRVSNYKGGAKACFCLSIDLDIPRKAKVKCDLREAVNRLLKTAEKYKVPISWGVCGSLVQNHPEIMEQIIKSLPSPDVGGHTFSHRNLADPSCSRREALSEIKKCKRVLKKLGVSDKIVTFIFPWNKVAYLDLLEEEGFIVFRGNNFGKLTYPKKVGGLWNIHGTYYLTEKSLSKLYVLKRIVDFAIAYGCVFHLWFHPWNVHINGNVERFIEGILEPLLEYVAIKRDEKLLWTCTLRRLPF